MFLNRSGGGVRQRTPNPSWGVGPHPPKVGKRDLSQANEKERDLIELFVRREDPPLQSCCNNLA